MLVAAMLRREAGGPVQRARRRRWPVADRSILAQLAAARSTAVDARAATTVRERRAPLRTWQEHAVVLRLVPMLAILGALYIDA